MTQKDIVQKLWGLCNVLRDEGINFIEGCKFKAGPEY